MTKEMKGVSLLLFIKDTIVFLKILCIFNTLHNVIPTLLLPGRSASRTYFPRVTTSSGLSSKSTRNKPALVWKPQWCGVQSKWKCSVSHPACGWVSPEFTHLWSFQIPADHLRLWAEQRCDSVTGILTHWKWCSGYTEAAYLWVSSACWELASWDGFTNTPLAALALKLSLPCISYIIHAPVVPAMSEISRVCGRCVISIQLNWYYYCNTGAKMALVVYKQ